MADLRARVDDPAKLAADVNRTVAARKSFSPTSAAVTQPPNSPALRPSHFANTPFRTDALGNAPSHALPASPAPSPFNQTTGTVEPKFNLGAAFNQAEVPTGTGGERLVPFSPPVNATPSFAQTVASTPPNISPEVTAPSVVGTPDIPVLTATGQSPAAPVAPQERGFSLAELLEAAGPASTGLGTIAGLGAGSALVAQNESQIQTGLSRDLAAAADVREENTATSQIESRASQANLAEASTTKLGFENAVNTRNLSLGLPLISKGGASDNFGFDSIKPALPGQPTTFIRQNKSGGGTEVNTTGIFAPVDQQAAQQTAQPGSPVSNFRIANPAFANATDQEVLVELRKIYDAQPKQ